MTHVEELSADCLYTYRFLPLESSCALFWVHDLSICLHLITDNDIGVHYGAGRHAILLKNPPALGKVRTCAKLSERSPV